MLARFKEKSQLKPEDLEPIWTQIATSIDEGDMDTELVSAQESTFKACDCVMIALELIKNGMFCFLFDIHNKLGKSDLKKKKEKAERRAEQLKDKAIAKKELEAEKLKASLEQTEQQIADAAQEAEDAILEVANLLPRVKPFFITPDSISRFPKPNIIMILNSSDVAHAEDWGRYADILENNGKFP